MATIHKNLSEYSKDSLPNGADFKVGIVVSEWNDGITSNLLQGAKDTFLESGILESDIIIKHVPGTFELPLGAKWMLEHYQLDGVVVIGVVIQGETRHFDFVCQGATQGIMDLNLQKGIPVAFCVLTDGNIQQSIDRSGGKHGNKGVESAIACLKMMALKKSMR
ncbi:MAG: 6,7-dimethyl-8-ribityllumazine synthase [Bacteroidetes bacterium]|nr:MAG: 6,7-dimethyl-8-ribityllumazine synthase [Bacteroidota bacterium]